MSIFKNRELEWALECINCHNFFLSVIIIFLIFKRLKLRILKDVISSRVKFLPSLMISSEICLNLLTENHHNKIQLGFRWLIWRNYQSNPAMKIVIYYSVFRICVFSFRVLIKLAEFIFCYRYICNEQG